LTFPTVTFAIFLVIVMAGSWLLRPHPGAWRSALLVASWVFYASMDWRFVVLLTAMIGGTHLVATAMTRWPRAQKRWLFVGIAADLIILGFFKYFGFFVTSLSALLEPFGLDPQIPLFEVILPIGISFYVFESIAYLIEVHRSVVEPMPLLDLAVYLSFFPKLVSGTITRPSEFHPQLARPMPADQVGGSTALWLMGRGLFKKLVIASFLATAITDGVFATPVLYSSLEVLAGIYGYAALI
jgi:D-alanyl-lipoteichoic acid acyltransferase DltB (MBOAT superfamily)